MTGWLRLERFHVVSDRLCAAGVFTGELLDSDCTTIGVGSRRRTVPAEIARSLHDMAVVIGPVDVDLLGLTVSIPAFTMDIGVVRRPLHADTELKLDVGAWPARTPRERRFASGGRGVTALWDNPPIPDACVARPGAHRTTTNRKAHS